MLARTVPPTADFHELARYFLNGKTGIPSPKRVAWSLPHNLPTDDALFAADLMAASAHLNTRTTKPCYHLMVGWAPHEKPTPEKMQTIAIETLHRAGLGEHQAFIMGHGDTHHDHLHMMINRVHPETGQTWKPSHDWRLFDRIMRDLADEHGFAFVPCHAFNPEETRHQRKRPDRRATYAGKRGAATNRPQWSTAEAETYGARLSERLDAASTWDDLIALIGADGLHLEAKGHGYVVGNADAYVKLSALGLTHTAKSYATPEPADDEPPPPHLRFSEHQLALRQPDITRVFAIAATYAELELGLHYHGLHLEPVGKSGLLLTDGLHQISLAQLQLDNPRCDLLAQWFEPKVINRLRKLTRPDIKPDENVETVSSPSPSARVHTSSYWQRHRREHPVRWLHLDPPSTGHAAPLLDAVDIAKGLAAWGLADADDLRAAIQDAIAERDAIREDTAPLMHRLLSDTLFKPPQRPKRPRPPPRNPHKCPAGRHSR